MARAEMEGRGAKIEQDPCLPLDEQPEAPVDKLSSVTSPASPKTKRQGGGPIRGILRGSRPSSLPGVMMRRNPPPVQMGGEDSSNLSPSIARRLFSSGSIKDSILSPLSSLSGRMKRRGSTGSTGSADSLTSPTTSPGSLRGLRSRLQRCRSGNLPSASGETFSSPATQCPGMRKTPSVESATSASGDSSRTLATRRRVNFCASPKNTVHDVTPYGKKYGVHPNFFNFDRKGFMRLTDDGIAEDLRRQEAGDQPLLLPGVPSS